jgi:hypothetical protein
MQWFVVMVINNAGLAIQSEPETIPAAESRIGLLTSRACTALVVLSSAIKCEESI